MPERRRNMWRCLGQRYGPQIKAFLQSAPGFLEDFEDLAEITINTRYTTRGAVVRPMPQTMNRATQTRPLPTLQDIAAQTEPALLYTRRSTPRVRDAETQTDTWQMESGEERRRERSSTRSQPTSSRRAHACWNCGRKDHVYIDCPHQRRTFCYGCGHAGHTMRTCPRCAQEWANLSPYHPRHGHVAQAPWGKQQER